MRPNPSWEHVYAIAFEEYGVKVEVEALHAALRRAYHHGGFGFEAGFEPTEETSFARTMQIDSAALADLGLEPMPESFFRRLSELFMLTSNWHVFPDVDAGPRRRSARAGWWSGRSATGSGSCPELLHALDLVQPLRLHRRQLAHRLREAAPGDLPLGARAGRASSPAEAIHVGDHLDADVAGARGGGDRSRCSSTGASASRGLTSRRACR